MIRGAMSNDGTSFIRKQIFLSLGLFFSCSNLGAMCPQTVGPITASDGTWTVVSRIGQATNVIQSQICAIAPSSAGITDLSCSFTFGQTDVGGGNIYNIVSPGTYCMAQNITFTAGTAIRVNSSDVTIEMKGHTLSGGSNANTLGIGLGASVQNVTIQNGIIERLAGSFPTGGVGIIDQISNASQTLKNITIQNMSFNNNSVAAIGLNGSNSSTIFDVDGAFIENCDAYNSGRINVQGYSATVQNCEMYDNRSGVLSGIFLTGPSGGALIANDFLIQDCIVTCSFGIGLDGSGIQIQRVQNGAISNCMVMGGREPAIGAAGFTNMVISDCVSQGAVTHAFQINNPGVGLNPNANATLTIERCVAEASSTGFEINNGLNTTYAAVNIVDCIAEFNGVFGFVFNNATTVNWGNINVKGCSALGNGSVGFLVNSGAVAAVITDIVFENCVAQKNRGDGFQLSIFTPGGLIRDVVFRDCVAQANSSSVFSYGDGFSVGYAPFQVNGGHIFGVSCLNCVSQQNARDGFSFGLTTTFCKVLDSCAMLNTGTGFTNLGGTTNAFISNVALFNTAADYSGLAAVDTIVSRASNLSAVTGRSNTST